MLGLNLAGIFGALAMLLAGNVAKAADIRVLSTTALSPVFTDLAADFEKQSGHRLVFTWGASFGTAPDALPKRIRSGEPFDVAVMIGSALDDQIGRGYFVVDSKVDLATSRAGLAVRNGLPVPDISSVEELRRSLLDAQSVALSSGVSGVYVLGTMFPKLGIADQMRPKTVVIDAPELVGHALLRAQADLGLQQMSELLSVPGITVVGALPDAVQSVNVISAAVASRAQEPGAAQEWIRYLQTPRAAERLKIGGFDRP